MLGTTFLVKSLMNGDVTGFKGEPATGLVLNGYAVKIPSKFLFLCP